MTGPRNIKFSQFLEYARNSQYALWSIFGMFICMLFLQCCFFEKFSMDISIFSCFSYPSRISSIYLSKIAISIFIASFVLIFKRKYWTIYALGINAIWCIAELVYMQSFDNLLMDSYSFSMAGNLKGFTSSIYMYLETRYIWFAIPILLQGLTIYFWDNKKRSKWYMFVGVNLCAIFLAFGHIFIESYRWRNNAFRRPEIHLSSLWEPLTSHDQNISCLLYTHEYSEIHAFMALSYRMIFGREKPVDVEKLNTDIMPYIQPMDTIPVPKAKLVIVLVESLENWAIMPEITPNICHFMESRNTLYATKIKRQALKGNSMDGQQLVLTGVLPVQEGAACFRFPYNSYPSICELYDSSAIFVPGNDQIWNQKLMSKAFQVDTSYYCPFNDTEILLEYEKHAAKYDCSVILTSSSHSPFSSADSSNLVLPNDMPQSMANYLKCINYTDRCMGPSLKRLSELDDVVVVITGDHTIFTDKYRIPFNDWCVRSGNKQYCVKEGYCPLIAGGGGLELLFAYYRRGVSNGYFPNHLAFNR